MVWVVWCGRRWWEELGRELCGFLDCAGRGKRGWGNWRRQKGSDTFAPYLTHSPTEARQLSCLLQAMDEQTGGYKVWKTTRRFFLLFNSGSSSALLFSH